MATIVTGTAPQADLEQGHVGPTVTDKTAYYVRDITYKVLPFCIMFLVTFSVGAILASTLTFNKPIPHEGTIVISVLLAVFFFFFCIGGIYLYHKKHYPPLTKGPNAPDRPPPQESNLRSNARRYSARLKDAADTFVEFIRGRHIEPEEVIHPREANRPVELEDSTIHSIEQLPRRWQPQGERANERLPHVQKSNAAGGHHKAPSLHSSRNREPPINTTPRRHQHTRPGGSPYRHTHVPSEYTIPEEPEGELHSSYHIPAGRDAQTPQQPSSIGNSAYSLQGGNVLVSTPNFQTTGGHTDPRTRSRQFVNIPPNHQGSPYPVSPPIPNRRLPARPGTAGQHHNIPAPLRTGPLPPLPDRPRPNVGTAHAYVVHIPEDIGHQALAKQGLFIDLPSLSDEEIATAEPGDQSEGYVTTNPKGRPPENPKTGRDPAYKGVPGSPSLDLDWTQDISSPIGFSSPGPRKPPSSKKVATRGAGTTLEAQDDTYPGGRSVLDNNGRPGENNSSISSHPHIEAKEKREVIKKRHETSSPQPGPSHSKTSRSTGPPSQHGEKQPHTNATPSPPKPRPPTHQKPQPAQKRSPSPLPPIKAPSAPRQTPKLSLHITLGTTPSRNQAAAAAAVTVPEEPEISQKRTETPRAPDAAYKPRRADNLSSATKTMTATTPSRRQLPLKGGWTESFVIGYYRKQDPKPRPRNPARRGVDPNAPPPPLSSTASYHDPRYTHQQPRIPVPPRGSSQDFRSRSETGHRTASDSSTSASNDRRQHD
ncbi:hypothetical protein AAE478_004360 [Parahypoxylon ruwenzoriense]